MKTVVLLVFALTSAATGFAQERVQQFEIFGGAQFFRADISPALQGFGLAHLNAGGWNVSVTENVNRWVGGTLDFSGSYTRPSLTVSTPTTTAVFNNAINASVHTFMFGPSAVYRRGRFAPFARVLVGAANARASRTSKGVAEIGSAPTSSDNAFALAVGGGVDAGISRRLALRGTADWIRTAFSDFRDNGQNNLRVSAGIVFRFQP